MSVPAPVAYVGRGALPPRGSDPPSARGAGAVDSGDQPGFGALLGGLMQAPENSPPPRPADTATPDGTEWTRDPAASAKEQDPAARAPSASTQPRLSCHPTSTRT